MIERYVTEMTEVSTLIRKKIVWRGLVSASSESISILGYALALCYGGFLVANGEIHFKNIIKYESYAIAFSASKVCYEIFFYFSFHLLQSDRRPTFRHNGNDQCIDLHSIVYGSNRCGASYFPDNRSCSTDLFANCGQQKS